MLTVAYAIFHHEMARHVTVQVEVAPGAFLTEIRRLPPLNLIRRPSPLMGTLDSMFYGWTPIVLLASPFLLLLFRQRVFMIMVGGSIAGYLPIIRVPLLSILYIYLTYGEILLTPARNVDFLVYLLIGVLIFKLAVELGRASGRVLRWALAVGVAGLLVCAFRFGGPLLLRHRDLLFVPAVLAYVIVFIVLRRNAPAALTEGAPVADYHGRWHTTAWILMVFLAVGAVVPDSSPFAIHTITSGTGPFPKSADLVFTPRALIDGLECVRTPPGLVPLKNPGGDYSLLPLSGVLSCPVSYALAKWSETSLPENAVLVANFFNIFAPSTFIPFPVYSSLPFRTGADPMLFYPKYYERVYAAAATRGAQPLFNVEDSLAERLEFLAAIGATHILLDPMYYDQVRSVLARWPEQFVPRYDDGRWAVYEVSAAR